jgi:acetyl-CoA acetyltransferase
MCAEKCASDYGFSREDQDAFAIESCKRAIEASKVCLISVDHFVLMVVVI